MNKVKESAKSSTELGGHFDESIEEEELQENQVVMDVIEREGGTYQVPAKLAAIQPDVLVSKGPYRLLNGAVYFG